VGEAEERSCLHIIRSKETDIGALELVRDMLQDAFCSSLCRRALQIALSIHMSIYPCLIQVKFTSAQEKI